MVKIRKTYVFVPDLTTPPPPAGPIDLGHILEDPAFLQPINIADHLPISSNEIYGPHRMDGFTATRKDLLHGKFGVWAKFLTLTLGLEARAEVGVEEDDDTEYRFGCLQTTYFNPTEDYIRSSMAGSEVRAYMRTTKFRVPVYMITGIKVGREVAADSRQTSTRSLGAASVIGRIGVVGPKIEFARTAIQGMSFTRGDDCVVALRFRKIRYKNGRVEQQVHTKGATMQDGSGTFPEDDIPELDLDGDEISDGDFDDLVQTVEGTVFDDQDESMWIVPEF